MCENKKDRIIIRFGGSGIDVINLDDIKRHPGNYTKEEINRAEMTEKLLPIYAKFFSESYENDDEDFD